MMEEAGEELDPQVVALFQKLARSGQRTPATVEERRSAYLAMRPLAGHPEPMRVDDRTIPRPAGNLPIRIYRPHAAITGILVFFHGECFNLGDLDTHDAPVRALTQAAECLTVSVGYRLAPAHPFPAATDDALAALDWVFEHAREFGGEQARLAIGGDSAGGNIATVVARRARDRGRPRLALQLLIYPLTDANMDTEPWRSFADNPIIAKSVGEQFYRAYASPKGSKGDLDNPDVSPSRAMDLSRLPRAFIATGAYHPLRDEGEAYAHRLHAAGVLVEHICYPGMPHGFFQMGGLVDIGICLIMDAAAALRVTLETA